LLGFNDVIIIFSEVANAFLHISLKQLFHVLNTRSDSCMEIMRIMYWAYRAKSNMLISKGKRIIGIIHIHEGVKQDDGLASIAFALTPQPMYTYENAIKNIANVQAVAILDDFSIIGRYADALQVFNRLFISNSLHHYNLRFNFSKC
jgi:hypothetical protein